MNEENDTSKNRMKPVIIVPPGTLTQEDVKKLESNMFLVVRSKNPELVRFIEPPMLGYSVQEKAAISLCRWILNYPSDTNFSRRTMAEKLCQLMIEGSPLHTPPYIPPAKQIKPKILETKAQ